MHLFFVASHDAKVVDVADVVFEPQGGRLVTEEYGVMSKKD